jgi:ribosome-associated protein
VPQVLDAKTSCPLSKHRCIMILINDTIAIAEKDLEERFIRGMGPGGQNARNEETAVQLRYDVTRSSLPVEVKLRLLALAGRRIDAEGVLIVESRAHRSQAANREAAHQRLLVLLRRAALVPAPRRATHPRRTDREMRLTAKRLRAAAKELRSRPPED